MGSRRREGVAPGSEQEKGAGCLSRQHPDILGGLRGKLVGIER